MSAIRALLYKDTLKSLSLELLNVNMKPTFAQVVCMNHTYSNARFVSKPSHSIKGQQEVKVCIIGASGCVGSKIALLLKLCPLVNSLCLFDMRSENEGVAKDLSHVSSKCRINAFTGPKMISQALLNAKVVVICASVKRNPGTTVSDLFEPNADIVIQVARACTKTCPKANIVLVSQPVESLLPLISEVYKQENCYKIGKVIGVTSANVMRSITLMAEGLKCSPFDIVVPVIGGHSKDTIVPVFTRAYPDPTVHHGKPEKRLQMKQVLAPFMMKDQSELVKATIHDMNLIVKNSEDWIFRANRFQESAAVTGAASAASTTIKIIQAMTIPKIIHDYAYVRTDVIPGLTYSTILVRYGSEGVKSHYTTRVNSSVEKLLLVEAIQTLRPLIEKGEHYVLNKHH